MSEMTVFRMKDRRVGDVVRDNSGKRHFKKLLGVLEEGYHERMKRAYSADVMTSLLRSMTKFCTKVLRVSDDKDP